MTPHSIIEWKYAKQTDIKISVAMSLPDTSHYNRWFLPRAMDNILIFVLCVKLLCLQAREFSYLLL